MNYYSVVGLSYEQKVELYMKCSKQELAQMLATRDELSKEFSYTTPFYNPYVNTVTCTRIIK